MVNTAMESIIEVAKKLDVPLKNRSYLRYSQYFFSHTIAFFSGRTTSRGRHTHCPCTAQSSMDIGPHFDMLEPLAEGFVVEPGPWD
jgi:hypothetical protein